MANVEDIAVRLLEISLTFAIVVFASEAMEGVFAITAPSCFVLVSRFAMTLSRRFTELVSAGSVSRAVTAVRSESIFGTMFPTAGNSSLLTLSISPFEFTPVSLSPTLWYSVLLLIFSSIDEVPSMSVTSTASEPAGTFSLRSRLSSTLMCPGLSYSYSISLTSPTL